MAFTKMLWKIGYTAPASWNLWKSVRSQIFKLWNFTYTKSNGNIAYYALVHVDGIYVEMEGTGKGKMPILISPDPNAVAFFRTYGASTQSYTSQGWFYDINNIKWYYCYATAGLPESLTVDIPTEPCELNSKDNPYTYNSAGMLQAAQDLLDKVYDIPFDRDYSQYSYQQTIPNIPIADKRATLRKAYGDFLWTNFESGWCIDNPRHYAFLQDNADAIIEELLTRIGNDNFCQIVCNMYEQYDTVAFTVYHATIPNPWSPQMLNGISVFNGFEAYNLMTSAGAGTDELVRVNGNETTGYSVSYYSYPNSGSDVMLGISAVYGYSNWFVRIKATNLGTGL